MKNKNWLFVLSVVLVFAALFGNMFMLWCLSQQMQALQTMSEAAFMGEALIYEAIVNGTQEKLDI